MIFCVWDTFPITLELSVVPQNWGSSIQHSKDSHKSLWPDRPSTVMKSGENWTHQIKSKLTINLNSMRRRMRMRSHGRVGWKGRSSFFCAVESERRVAHLSPRDIGDFSCIAPGASSRKGQPLIPCLGSRYGKMPRPVINNPHYTGSTAACLR